jgi:O-antigen ligase
MPAVTVEASTPPAEQPPREGGTAPARARPEARIASALLALVPGALVIYFSFNAGGFFPSSVGFATLLVVQMLVLRVLVAQKPFAGYTRLLGIAALALGAYAAWTLASQLWSDTPDRALTEYDRALLYLGLLVLFGLAPRPQWRIPWILRGLVIGIVFVCACALITRVLPNVWHTSPGLANNRLSFPLTYWNSLGLLAAIGVIMSLGVSANGAERPWVRALAAACVPIVATTLLFTFSRGAMVGLLIGLVAYFIVARSSALVGALLAIVPTTVVALVAAYQADLLATLNPTTPAAVDQGKTVAIVVLVCVVAAGALRLLTTRVDSALARRTSWPMSRRTARVAVAVGAAAIVIVVIGAGGPGWVQHQWHAFIQGAPVETTDLRSRLTDPSSNGRTDQWRAALDGFADAPVLGNGAGTYQFLWEKHRKAGNVVDAHSLYAEVLGELGVPGLVFLVVTFVLILLALARRVRGRGPNRLAYGALFAATLVWLVHAGYDWDWEMPAVTAWVFAAGGAALAGRTSADTGRQMGDRGRIPIAACLLVAAAAPALVMLSQFRLEASASAFERNDCKGATSEAFSSINVLSIRPEPYQMIGYCDLDNGRLNEAVDAMQKAVDQEPKRWEYHYSLSVAQAAAGQDPRRELAEATRLNPAEPLVKQAQEALVGTPAASWPKAAEALTASAEESGQLTLR